MGVLWDRNKSWYFFYKKEKDKCGEGQYRSDPEFLFDLVRRTMEEYHLEYVKIECRLFMPPRKVEWERDTGEDFEAFMEKAYQLKAELEAQYEKEVC